MSCYTHGARKEQETASSADHDRTVVDRTVVDAMDRAKPVTAASSFSLSCVAEINLNFL